ncbi:MAG: hypothetical protein AAF479_11145 [Pseudomonadota bacterium]
MGYRDDFFKADHIIGYTGKIDKLPTVYFRREVENGFEFGRITQHYPDDKTNVGRGVVRIARDYKIYNFQVKESFLLLFSKTVTHSFEYYEKNVRHESRSAFVGADDFKQNDINLLTQSIVKFTTIKTRYLL